MPFDPIRREPSVKVRAYRQAPWRVQTRLLAIGLASVFGLMAMLSLFIFAGAQAAEAGLRVQRLIRERDQLLRTLSAQQGVLARLRSEEFLRDRAQALGFEPATPQEMDFVDMPAAPERNILADSPTAILFSEQDMSMPPAYRETLLEWVLRIIRPSGRG